MANEAKNGEQVSKVEVIKRQSNYLRGTIKEALEDGAPSFGEDNQQLLKFHGVYQQDDRDLRQKLKQEGKDRHYTMMIRARIPGGVLSPEQYLKFDELADKYNEYKSLRITTRQTIQLHGVVKGDLKATIRELNDVLVTTLGGCGDQVRNIIGCAEPGDEPFRQEMHEDVLALVARLGAKTRAYHEIWLDGEQVKLDDGQEEEPLYGATYLPRKFKLAMAPEGDNCVDVYDNDIGMVAHIEDNHVVGYTLLVGGGMGRTATDSKTYPRLASPLCFVTRDRLADTCAAVVTIQRDYGNRANRRYARMKYLIDERGLNWFAAELENRLGGALTPPRQLTWKGSHDHLGWHSHGENKNYLGIFVQNGRVIDTQKMKLKSVLREIVSEFRPTIRLTTQQNIILADLPSDARSVIEQKLRAAGVPLVEDLSRTRVNSMACVALPTCGLAMAESERALPLLLPEIEKLFGEYGIADEEVTIRMTGCPNGCARPYNAEIAFVGRALGKYDVFLGGSFMGTRLNRLYKSTVPFEQLVDSLRPVIAAYAQERAAGERFGDFVERIGFERFQAGDEVVG